MRSMYIHKNTLYSRLNKISQVLGKDILDSEAGFTLMLGIKIHMLVETVFCHLTLAAEGGY